MLGGYKNWKSIGLLYLPISFAWVKECIVMLKKYSNHLSVTDVGLKEVKDGGCISICSYLFLVPDTVSVWGVDCTFVVVVVT